VLLRLAAASPAAAVAPALAEAGIVPLAEMAVVPRRITRATSKNGPPAAFSSEKNVRWITRPIWGLPVVMLTTSYSGTSVWTRAGSNTYWNLPPSTSTSPCSITAPGVMSA
jgi:hypothetical protein